MRKIRIMSLVLALAAAWAMPAFAARPIQGAVGEVTTADAAALGTVGWRIWSALPGGTTVFNNNVASCRNVRCIRSFVTNATLAAPGAPGGGGYVSNAEATNAYNADAQEQPFYLLADADMSHATVNHIAFYGVSGVTANNAGLGQFLARDCGATGGQNCAGRIDTVSAGPPLTNTWGSYGGTNTIRPVSGLNPVPNVRVVATGSGSFLLTWNDPRQYPDTMRPSNFAPAPPSPVIGVGLYKCDRPSGDATAPTGDDACWTKMGDYPLGAGSAGVADTVPSGVGTRWYSLTVRCVGPGGLPNEMETYRGANSQPARGDATSVRIEQVTASYAGHGNVLVGWKSGIEGDTLGYYVTRSSVPDGPYQRLSGLIPARGDATLYRYTDSVPAATGRSYYYRIEAAAREGNIFASSIVFVTAPGRTTKAGPRIR
jgi:hypothetical protein